MRARKFRHSYYDSAGRYRFKNYYKIGSRYGRLLPSGFYDTQTWGALDKAWLGYVIAKNKGEHDKQIHYASIIQKLQRELDLEVSSFPALGLYSKHSEDKLIDRYNEGIIEGEEKKEEYYEESTT